MIDMSDRVYSTVNHFPAVKGEPAEDPNAQPWQKASKFVDRGIQPCVSVFRSKDRAVAFITSKAKDLVARGDFQTFPPYSHDPAPVPSGIEVRIGGSNSTPVMAPAPSHVECVVHEILLLRLKDGVMCSYRVTQHPVT